MRGRGGHGERGITYIHTHIHTHTYTLRSNSTRIVSSMADNPGMVAQLAVCVCVCVCVCVYVLDKIC